MNRKFFIIANPASGRKKAKVALKKLEERLSYEGLESQVFMTPGTENLATIIRDALPPDTTDIVVIGGDGTLNAVGNAIQNKDLVLNIVPAGTGNDFVKNLEIGKNLMEWIDTIINGQIKEIDIGRCNDRVFLNGVGLGFDGQIVHDHLFTQSILSGHAKYYSHVLRILGSFKPRSVRFELDKNGSQSERLILMAVMNGTTFGGGFKLNPLAQIDDGELNICTIRDIHPVKRFLNVGRLSFGTHGVLKAVEFDQAKSIYVEGDDSIHAHIDGEYHGHPPYEIEIIPNGLKVRVRT